MAIRSSAGLGGSIPQMNRMPLGPGVKPLFHSVRDIALILDKTVQKGYGVLKTGTILAENTVSKLLVPCAPTERGGMDDPAAYVVNSIATGTAVINVLKDDSYMFQVGDVLITSAVVAAVKTYKDLGAIISIDRTSNPTYAIITATTNIDVATFTTANGACAYVKAGTTGKFSTAKYILDKDIDTGVGSDAKGANTSVVINNAVLYTASLVNYDAAALAALGAVEDGRFLILK